MSNHDQYYTKPMTFYVSTSWDNHKDDLREIIAFCAGHMSYGHATDIRFKVKRSDWRYKYSDDSGKKQWEHELWIKFRDNENWVIAEQGQSFIFCQELGILFAKDAEYFLKGATAHKIVDYRHGVYTSEQEYIDKLQETRNFLNTIGAAEGEQQ